MAHNDPDSTDPTCYIVGCGMAPINSPAELARAMNPPMINGVRPRVFTMQHMDAPTVPRYSILGAIVPDYVERIWEIRPDGTRVLVDVEPGNHTYHSTTDERFDRRYDGQGGHR